MPNLRTIASTLQGLRSPTVAPLRPAPAYAPTKPPNAATGPARGLGLAVANMRHHMTDEGWQVFAGLQHAGYTLAGKQIPTPSDPDGEVDVRDILPQTMPEVVVVQDKREWDTGIRDFRDRSCKFHRVELLKHRHDLFKLTILKDAHARPDYHRQSADEMGVQAWIVYYHPDIVYHVAPYVRPEHCIRVYHTVDKEKVPEFTAHGRRGCLLSGAVSSVYPLRKRLFDEWSSLPTTTVLKHPGYHRKGTATPSFLKELSRHKVAICTSSIYGYALRKIIEATACGCLVVTDLPTDEVLPHIDGNLVRIAPNTPTSEVSELLKMLYAGYDADRQLHYAKQAKEFYDYRAAGVRLVEGIEQLRQTYAV